MEFLRFGSSIPGSYWGCCAVDIIQNFKFDPDQKASIELVNGDNGFPLSKNGKYLFAGKTYHEIFRLRLRIGTFSSKNMPNHGFIAVLTDEQIRGGCGKKWLKILRDEGFEFIRTVDNSVYSGDRLADEGEVSSHPNHIFGLFRNVGQGAISDPFTPPKPWTDLKPPKKTDLELYKDLLELPFYTEEELEKDGIPITYAGKRSRYPQQPKKARLSLEEEDPSLKKSASPFSKDKTDSPDYF